MSSDKKNKDHLSFFKRAISSASSALFTKTIVNPFDVIKTYIQAEYTIPGRKEVINAKMAEMKRTPKFLKRSFAATSLIWHDGGIKSLWSGLTPALLIAIPNSTIYYSTYDEIKYRLLPYCNNNRFMSTIVLPVVCGVTSRSLAVVIVEPLEFLKTQVQAKMNGGLKGSMKRIYSESKIHGVRYLWKGVYTNLLRDISFAGFHWLILEQCKLYIKPLAIPKQLKSFICGFTAGGLAALLVNPFDVVKTQQQVRSGKALPSFSIMNSIYQIDGWRGLMRGVGPRITKSACACALMITFYDVGKDLLSKALRKK